jgi:hypothetical protein
MIVQNVWWVVHGVKLLKMSGKIVMVRRRGDRRVGVEERRGLCRRDWGFTWDDAGFIGDIVSLCAGNLV